jgi:hypothetical protein
MFRQPLVVGMPEAFVIAVTKLLAEFTHGLVTVSVPTTGPGGGTRFGGTSTGMVASSAITILFR